MAKAKAKMSRDGRMRERLIQEAARIMAVEGVRDFSHAKRKAALHLGAPTTTNLPQNREIQAALHDYQRLFGGERQQSALRTMREAALEAMGFFAAFRPKLVGAVLDGTAGADGAVDLHCFADTPEEVVLFLLEQGIPFDTEERRVRFDEDYVFVPMHRFVADEIPFNLTVFTGQGRRQAPRSPVDGKPMRRAGRDEVAALIAEAATS